MLIRMTGICCDGSLYLYHSIAGQPSANVCMHVRNRYPNKFDTGMQD